MAVSSNKAVPPFSLLQVHPGHRKSFREPPGMRQVFSLHQKHVSFRTIEGKVFFTKYSIALRTGYSIFFSRSDTGLFRHADTRAGQVVANVLSLIPLGRIIAGLGRSRWPVRSQGEEQWFLPDGLSSQRRFTALSVQWSLPHSC
jgi:hypothetical protein